MTFSRLEVRDGWQVPVNNKGEQDWLCPKCGHEHTSCCGNSHFPCKKGPNYAGECKCSYLDSLGSMDYLMRRASEFGSQVSSEYGINGFRGVDDGSMTLLNGTRVNKANP